MSGNLLFGHKDPNMKRTFILAFAALALSFESSAQLVNGGFENWTGQVPDGWSANNIEALGAVVITQTNEAHGGAFAVRGEAIINPLNANELYPPVLQNLGLPVTQGPSHLTGWYKFSPTAGTSSLVLSITVTDAGGQTTGFGFQQITNAAASYTSFSIPVDYTNGSANPSTNVVVSAILGLAAGTAGAGSTFHLDDLSISGAVVGMEEMELDFSIGRPFPQPAMGSSTIELRIDTDQRMKATVHDATGREVEVLFDREMSAGDHRITWTPSDAIADGKYIARFVGEEGTIHVPIILVR